jgi:hypothetical protein
MSSAGTPPTGTSRAREGRPGSPRFWQRGIERLVSLIAPDNHRSQRVAEKLGARPQQRVETAGGPADVWAYPPPS